MSACIRFRTREELSQLESYLLSQPEVCDASLYYSDSKLHAHVVIEETAVRPEVLQAACVAQFGPAVAPDRVVCVVDHRRAA